MRRSRARSTAAPTRRARQRQPRRHAQPRARGARPACRADHRPAQAAVDGPGRDGAGSAARCSSAITPAPEPGRHPRSHLLGASSRGCGSRPRLERDRAQRRGVRRLGVPVALVTGDQHLRAGARATSATSRPSRSRTRSPATPRARCTRRRRAASGSVGRGRAVRRAAHGGPAVPAAAAARARDRLRQQRLRRRRRVVPATERTGGSTCAYRAPDAATLIQVIQAWTILAGTTATVRGTASVTAAWVAGWRGLGHLLGGDRLADDPFGARFGGRVVAGARRAVAARPCARAWCGSAGRRLGRLHAGADAG